MYIFFSQISAEASLNWVDKTAELFSNCDAKRCNLPAYKLGPESSRVYWLICYGCFIGKVTTLNKLNDGNDQIVISLKIERHIFERSKTRVNLIIFYFERA